MENSRASSLRWGILRRALLRRASPDSQSESETNLISRKAKNGFNLIPCSHHLQQTPHSLQNETCLRYTLPIHTSPQPQLHLFERVRDHTNLSDFGICNQFNIDNTGLVCHWPSEEVLAHYCLLHADMFRSRKVIELGSGYGLAGLIIAMVSDASEVVISDGNPQVVDYIQRNICANSGSFGGTKVKPLMLHWNQEDISDISNSFDLIIASDCTFFKDFHKGLARIVKLLLKKEGPSEAMFLSPKRGDSLEKFLAQVEDCGLHFSIDERYDTQVWRRHQGFINGEDDSWPNYDKDHCYPLLVRITH